MDQNITKAELLQERMSNFAADTIAWATVQRSSLHNRSNYSFHAPHRANYPKL